MTAARIPVAAWLMAAAVAAVLPAQAEMWTNAAGHAIEAKVVGGDAETVMLERPNGVRLSIPLLSLSPAARKTAAQQVAKLAPVKPPSPAAPPADAVKDHVRGLHREGLISDGELQATLNSLPRPDKQPAP